MSARPREMSQPLPAGAERGIRGTRDAAERIFGDKNELVSLSGGDDTSRGTLDGDNATPFPQYDKMTRALPETTDEIETTIPVPKENQAVPFTPSVEVNSGTLLSQKDKTVERVHSSVQDIKTPVLRQHENVVNSRPPEQDNRVTSSQAVLTAQPPGSIEDAACKPKVYCVLGRWYLQTNA
jgi:hypothetical protein